MDCGRHAWLQQDIDDPTRYRIAANGCRDRFCLVCQQQRSRLIARNLSDHLPACSLRFVTLTLRSSDLPLREELDRLYHAFRRLRSSRWWKRLVDGGVAFLELTWNSKRAQWHPHLHLIVSGRYIPQAELSQEWHARTRDSFVVDVRAVRAASEVAAYVTQYVSKTAVPDAHIPPDRLDEWCGAVEARKLLACWGTFRAFRLLHPEPSDGSWETICSLNKAIERIEAGDDPLFADLSRNFPGLVRAYWSNYSDAPDTS